MPLTSDESTLTTATTLVSTLKGAFGTPPGYRPAHARGRLTHGTFTPTSAASSLSTAPHFNAPSTPLLLRFSSSTGLPQIPDTDPNAQPRGIGIRFLLSEDGHKHTDIIAHSTPFFPSRTGEGFLEVLKAIGDGSIGDYLSTHPAAKAFVEAPKPAPESFGTERYYGVNAYRLVDSNGKGTVIRWRIEPEASYSVLSADDVAKKSSSYLFDELEERLGKGKVTFKLLAQVAEESDTIDDCTVHWPESREVVELGKIEVEKWVEEKESLRQQQRVIFDPEPKVQGVETTGDPLFGVRSAVYLVSGRERRAAASTAEA